MQPLTPDSHRTACDTVAELLPWYTNGTLGAPDRAFVESHAAECAQCSAAVKFERRIAESMRTPRDNVERSPHAAWQRLEARLTGRPVRRAKAASRLRRRWSPFRILVAAQAATIVALAVLLFIDRSDQTRPAYRTLSAADPALASEAPLVRIAFDSSVKEADAAAIADDAGGRLVAGPSPNNVYTLAFRGDEPAASIDERVARLRRQPGVLLAEPITLGRSN